ncbi:MAG: SDR family oxidoreductase [Deltaproteobacteria bacterium]|nr:SDR family oxidoreductase [Deltaproteobacteria bacterium]
MDLGLKGKLAVVAGGSAGIGAAVARGLALEGADLVLVARHGERLHAFAEELTRTLGAHVLPLTADLTVPGEAEGLIRAADERFGRVDILVNCAGRSYLGDLQEFTDEAWDQALQGNLMAAVRCCRAAVPVMIRQGGGRIINIGAVSALQPSEGQLGSNAAKAALVNFSKSLANEVARHRILVNCVNPGRCLNERWRQRAEESACREGGTPEEFLDRVARQHIPLGRFGRAEEVAALVVFLASEPAGYITGQSICVDGGMLRSAF